MKKMQIIIFVIALVCFLGSGGYLAKYFWERHVSSENMDEVKSLLLEDDTIQIDEVDGEKRDNTNVLLRYSQLYEINSDFAGWINIPGTTIDYPVMYVAGDNDRYLYANFKKEWDGGGTPFIDGNCSLDPISDNLIIYGHNMNDKSMFQPLTNYEEKEFYDDHKIIKFDTVKEEGTYEIVAVILARALTVDEDGFRYYGHLNFADEADFNEYWRNIQQMALYETDETAEYGDQLITLSTCEYSQEDGRMAVIARKK